MATVNLKASLPNYTAHSSATALSTVKRSTKTTRKNHLRRPSGSRCCPYPCPHLPIPQSNSTAIICANSLKIQET